MVALIILIVWQTLGLAVHLCNHGEKRKDNYNFWMATLCLAIQWVLIYYIAISHVIG